MEISVIASGSNGNSCLVEKKENGREIGILIDAGKSAREIVNRMNNLGKSMENVSAVIITHTHHDHICGAGILSRRYGIPVYVSDEVYNDARFKLGDAEIRKFSLSRGFKIEGVEIRPVLTSHNVSSCGFVIGNFGIFTDTGIVTEQMKDVLPKLRGVLLESNHDIEMLINGPYPAYLKQWILSERGHLSNIDAGKFVQQKGKNLSFALLGHLSGNNNTPSVARKTFETLVKRKVEHDVCLRERENGGWEV